MTNQPDFRKLLDEATDVLDAVPPPCGCPFCGEDPYYRSEFGEPLGIVCCEVLAWFRESDEETQEVREAVLKLLGHRGELRTALSAAVNALPAHLARIAELEAALAFYADPANHIGYPDPSAKVYIETSAIDRDGGDRARAALSGGKP